MDLTLKRYNPQMQSSNRSMHQSLKQFSQTNQNRQEEHLKQKQLSNLMNFQKKHMTSGSSIGYNEADMDINDL